MTSFSLEIIDHWFSMSFSSLCWVKGKYTEVCVEYCRILIVLLYNANTHSQKLCNTVVGIYDFGSILPYIQLLHMVICLYCSKFFLDLHLKCKFQVPVQRALAFHLLGSVLYKALDNIHQHQVGNTIKSVNNSGQFIDWEAVWAYALGPEPELVLALR